MPLLTSPIDGSPMQQIQRFGIEIDVCPTSGGIWLDKGELEKLMAFIKNAAEEEARQYQEISAAPVQQAAPRQEYREERRPDPRYDDRDRDRYYEDRKYDKKYGKKRKKKSALSEVLDIFDF